ncbi:MAG TPA: hypothetical protein VHE35_03420 [Kofleriaceae bacterium]|nr:hypothetical protein [Kofleriaceae bacterium]
MTRSRSIVLVCAAALALGGVAACGGGGSGGQGHEAHDPANHPPKDTRTPIQVRRDAACEALGPRLTACAIADAHATMTPDEIAKLDLEKTAAAHTEEFVSQCKQQELSSRQVRVYEVCMAQETECDPLMSCLDNAKPKPAATP